MQLNLSTKELKTKRNLAKQEAYRKVLLTQRHLILTQRLVIIKNLSPVKGLENADAVKLFALTLLCTTILYLSRTWSKLLFKQEIIYSCLRCKFNKNRQCA